MLKTPSLIPNAHTIICDKSTERPFTGSYDQHDQKGSYLCRQCGLALFRSQHKFHSGCGWPSFDEEIEGAVKRLADADGMRTEILCNRCDAHLGHVFKNEGLTPKNTRHCVNSLSLDFVPNSMVLDSEEAILAGGCFWGVEYYIKRVPGVLGAEVGYIGGDADYPTYNQVCGGGTGHLEATRVLYDPEKITYKDLIQAFFRIHDPTQIGGQGPDIGSQYCSAIFYYDEAQLAAAKDVIAKFEESGQSVFANFAKDKILATTRFKVSTRLLPVSTFWPAEEYHQDYYEKTGKAPYCHRPA